ncbi:stage II sporulation protein M [Halobaculum sp. EA56]|uniref:stage II sporulation protein M n=1 Tax=Halobaculum sp. EA56 TaxID=3421648 RepID=UPI003EBB4355
MSRPPDGSRSIAGALGAAGRLLRDRPAAVLPAYLLAIGLTAAARVPLTLALVAAAASLALTGRLEPLVRAAADLQEAAREGGSGGGGGPGTGGVPGTIPPGVETAVTDAVTPTVVAALALGVAGAVVVGVLARAVASAVTYGTVWAGLDGRPPLVDGVRTAGRWRTFLGISLVRIAVVAVAIGVPLAVAAGLATRPGVVVSPSGIGALGVLLAVAVAGLGAVGVAITWFLLAFAEPAAVVDRRGAVRAVRASLGFVRAHPARALGFALVAVGGYVGAAVGVAAANAAGAGRLGGIVLPLVVVPVLEAGATALYAGVDGPAAARAERPSARARLRAGLASGWRELVGFVVGHPLAVFAAVATLAGAAAGGYAVTAPYGVRVPPPADVSGVFGAVAVGPFLTIAANNWLVSAGLAFGGVAFGLPAVTGLAFNGALVGALAGVFDRTAFLALVGPHGVLELPVIAVAGALGLHLGGVGWRWLRGRTDAAEVAGELERAAYVLVGVAILLVVAAAIEAFLTPRVAAAVLGG